MIAGAYLSIVGMVTFSMFILEESIQTCIFGTWPARTAKQWHIVLRGLDTMRGFNLTIKIINYSVGWIQPFAFFSYRAYSHATDFYITGASAEIFAHAPELFEGRKIDFMFFPKRIENIDNKYIVTNGKIGVVYDSMPILKQQHINGVLVKYDKYLVVKND